MIAIPSAPIWQSPEPCPQPAPDKVTLSAQLCDLEFALITKAELNKNSGCKVFLISYSESTEVLCFFWSFAKSLKNVQKISRKATEIIEKSTENQLKPKKTNGF